MAVEMRNALAEAVGRRLPATLLFDYPSVARLADYFAEDLFGWHAEDTNEVPPPGDQDNSYSNEALSDEMAAAMIVAELEKWSGRNA